MKYIVDYKQDKKCYTQSVSIGDNTSRDKLFDNLIASGNKDEKETWLDTNSAAKYLDLTPNALRILVHRKKIEFYKLGHRLRFSLQSLNNVLVKQGV